MLFLIVFFYLYFRGCKYLNFIFDLQEMSEKIFRQLRWEMGDGRWETLDARPIFWSHPNAYRMRGS